MLKKVISSNFICLLMTYNLFSPDALDDWTFIASYFRYLKDKPTSPKYY